jgi:predicted RNase H-like nuclease (RuvC/YqgF family)
MKRAFILLSLVLIAGGRRATAQDAAPAPNPPATTAAAIAAQDAADERFKRLTADIEALRTDNEALRAKIAALEQTIETLRHDQAAAKNSGVQDDIKTLADKIVEVDRKRVADREAISEEIRKAIKSLEKTAATHIPAPKEPVDTATTLTPAAQNGYSYIIQDGDTLSAILKAYNKGFKEKGLKTITLKQTEEANPNITDWNHLQVGHKIIIPRPPDGA